MDTSRKVQETTSTACYSDLEQLRSSLILGKLSRGLNNIVRCLMWTAAVILFVYMCFMFLDVILRYVFNRPIQYDLDITQIILVFLCFFSLGYTQIKKSHIKVDIVTSKLSPKAALTLSTSTYIICLAISCLIIWQGIFNSLNFYKSGIMTTGGLPFFPATLIMPFGGVILSFVFLQDIINQIFEARKSDFGIARWLLMISLPLIFISAAIFFMFHLAVPVSSFTAGIIGILLLFILIFLGMPIGFALFTIAIIVMGYSANANAGFMVMGGSLFNHVSSYNWIVIPLYILMSYFIMAGGLGESAFLSFYKWIGHLRGGLAMAVVAGSTALAAVVGTGAAAIVTMGLVAFPEMRKYKYNDSLSTGAISAGATIGPIIPPSVTFIIYGIMVEKSIGTLFIAGVVPGLVLAFGFIITIAIWSRINPKLGPAAQKFSWGERIRTIPTFGPIVALFILVIGGIYTGIFSVIEAGGIAAFCALVIAVASRKITWNALKNAHSDTIKFIGMIFPMVVGSLLLSNSLGASGVSYKIAEICAGLQVPPMIFIILILVLFMLFGIIADAMIIFMLTIPIVAPILETLGIDLIWFGVIASIVAGLGSITPPYALCIFVLRNIVCQDVPLSVMYRGILPFCILTILAVALMLLFPEIVMWLPKLMLR